MKLVVSKKTKKIIFKCFCIKIVVFLFGLNIARADNFNASNGVCELTLGMSDWPPYQMLSDDGVASGLQIKLLRQIADEVGCRLKYKSMTFPQGLVALQQGTIDFQMNATASEDRARFGYFSVPYRNEFLSLYSTQTYREQCQSMNLEQLIAEGFVLGLQKDLVYGEELIQIQKDPVLSKKLRYVDSNIQHLKLVESKGLDGIVDDPVVVSYRSTVHITGDALTSCPIVVSSSPISLIFSKVTVTPQLVEQFNSAIKKIQDTEAYHKQWSW
jgi:polar amino acid transport system substrate-binding protein